MKIDAEPFLQRIRAYPDDDVPRLVFADWLEEQARTEPPLDASRLAARAAFIRVQLALARLPADADAHTEPEVSWAGSREELEETRSRLQLAERGLLDVHEEEWAAAFRVLAAGPVFRRGFVEEVRVTAREYLRHAHELFAAGPIRHIHFTELGGSLTALARCPYLSRLSAVSVYAQHAGELLARTLAQCPYLADLRVLNLARNRLTDEDVAVLAWSPGLGSLEDLNLAENDFGEGGARSLAAAVGLPRLARLDLRNNRLGPVGAEVLAESDRLAGLRWLRLAGNDLGVSRLHTLARAGGLLRVRVLDLAANGLTAKALELLLGGDPRADGGGHELDLSHNEFGDDGAWVLAASRHAGRLAALRLVGCGLTDAGVRALATSPHLARLVALDLSRNPISDAGCRELLDSPSFKRLRRLLLPDIGVSQRMHRALDARFRRPAARG